MCTWSREKGAGPGDSRILLDVLETESELVELCAGGQVHDPQLAGAGAAVGGEEAASGPVAPRRGAQPPHAGHARTQPRAWHHGLQTQHVEFQRRA